MANNIVITQENTQLLITEESGNQTVVFATGSPSIVLSAEGPQGAAGPAGSGVPSGGTVNDLLVRTASGTGWTSNPVVDSLLFDITASGAITPGQLRWNQDEHTLDLGQLRGVVNQLGQEITITCINTSANTIGNGKAVMFVGTDDATQHPEVSSMIANGSVPGRVFFGVTTEDIASGEEGYVTTFGKVRGVDTSAFPNDSILWCDPENPGEFVLTEPEAPRLKIAAAAVIISHPTNGVLFVRADTGQNLADCHDVESATAQDGDFLGWSEDMQHWMPYAVKNEAPKSITIAEPLAGDSFTLFRTSKDTTLDSVVGLVVGNSSPLVSYELRYAADRTASGTVAVPLSVVTNTTSGATASVQNMPVPSGSYVWVDIVTVSGVTSEFNLSIGF